jgi:hypothetical protein
VSDAAWFGIPKRPNCLVQQLMPINGLTTRGDLMLGKIIPYFRGKKKAFSFMPDMRRGF